MLPWVDSSCSSRSWLLVLSLSLLLPQTDTSISNCFICDPQTYPALPGLNLMPVEMKCLPCGYLGQKLRGISRPKVQAPKGLSWLKVQGISRPKVQGISRPKVQAPMGLSWSKVQGISRPKVQAPKGLSWLKVQGISRPKVQTPMGAKSSGGYQGQKFRLPWGCHG